MFSAIDQHEIKFAGKTFGSIIGWFIGQLFILHFLTNRAAYSLAFGGNNNNNNNNNNSRGNAYSADNSEIQGTTPLVAAPIHHQQQQQQQNGTADNMDEDVRTEMLRVEQETAHPTSESFDLVLANHVQKVYFGSSSSVSSSNDTVSEKTNCCTAMCQPGVDKVAVKDVTISVQGGSCLAVLGKNGCGKSTTTRMLTCEENPTSGLIQRRRLRNDGSLLISNGSPSTGFGLPSFDEETWQSRYGLVTQHDSLFENLTAEQHLDLYLSIRLGSSYRAADWQDYIKKCLTRVTLDDAETKCTSEYSGGMKRKCQLAISMFTGASFVSLDEVSTGIDSFSRRALWTSMHEALMDKSRSILLVTHSMEEASAVCTNVTIMKAGELCCFGSVQHLKNRFSGGYAITLFFDEPVLKEKSVDLDVAKHAANAKIRQELASVDIKLTESPGPTMTFSIENPPSISSIFTALARVKTELYLESYSVAQTGSLDTIFLKFAGIRAGAEEEN